MDICITENLKDILNELNKMNQAVKNLRRDKTYSYLDGMCLAFPYKNYEVGKKEIGYHMAKCNKINLGPLKSIPMYINGQELYQFHSNNKNKLKNILINDKYVLFKTNSEETLSIPIISEPNDDMKNFIKYNNKLKPNNINYDTYKRTILSESVISDILSSPATMICNLSENHKMILHKKSLIGLTKNSNVIVKTFDLKKYENCFLVIFEIKSTDISIIHSYTCINF